LHLQVKLLRVIETREYAAVGDTSRKRFEGKLIAATNRDLSAEITAGRFREDLYYRLNVILLETPALRERQGDVLFLARVFLDKFSKKFNKKMEGFDEASCIALEKHTWPGNVRELENVIERAVALEAGDQIRLSALDGVVGTSGQSLRGERSQGAVEFPDFSRGPVSLEGFLGRIEREVVYRALSHAKGNEEQAARLLQTTRTRVLASAKK